MKRWFPALLIVILILASSGIWLILAKYNRPLFSFLKADHSPKQSSNLVYSRIPKTTKPVHQHHENIKDTGIRGVNKPNNYLTIRIATRSKDLYQDYTQITALYKRGRLAYLQKDYYHALISFLDADHLGSKTGYKHPLRFDILYMAGLQLFNLNRFNQSQHVFDKVLSMPDQKDAPDSTLARLYSKLATILYYKGDYSESVRYFQNSKKYGVRAFGSEALFVSDQLNNLGVIRFMQGHYDEALSFYQSSLSIMQKAHNSTPTAIAGTYNNIALIFNEKRDYQNGEQFLLHALNLYLSDTLHSKSYIANTYMNLSALYSKLGQHDKQLTNLTQCLFYSEKYTTTLIPKVLSQLAVFYTERGAFIRAEKYYRKALHKNSMIFGEGPELAYILNNYAIFEYSVRHNFRKSLLLFQRALPRYRNYFGPHSKSTGNFYLNFARYYFEQQNYPEVLNQLQKALIANSSGFKPTDLCALPWPGQSLSDILLVEILKLQAECLTRMARDASSNTVSLRYSGLAFRDYQDITKLLEKIKMGYSDEESRIFLAENEQPTDTLAICNAIRLYKMTGDTGYMKKAFSLSDKDHASSLQSILKEREFPESIQPNDSSVLKFEQGNRDLSFYNDLILREKVSMHPDSSKIALWTQKKNELTLRVEQLSSRIQKDNPAYFAYKYRDKDPSLLPKIQNILKNNEALLEFFYADTILVTFCITKDNFSFLVRALPSDFNTTINSIRDFVTYPRFYQADSSYCLSYRAAGWSLYKTLLKPFERQMNQKSIIIVPYNKLLLIPFEVLLTASTRSRSFNFRQLPYLIKKHDIRYLYAANLIVLKNRKAAPKGFLAFVPDYSQKDILADLKTQPTIFHPLNQTIDEAKATIKYFPGKIYDFRNASEENFKNVAGNYSAILLAMHASSNDLHPRYSNLAFTPHSSRNEDDFLYAYETRNLQLNAQLLVLSACNTGQGPIRKGEGMLSLSRGFSMAGVPSIVTTLWSINDNCSARLMEFFYKGMHMHFRKSKALQDAKLNYIQHTDLIHAHPYFWSGYVLIGNNAPLMLHGNKHPAFLIQVMCLVSVFMITVMVLIFRRKRKFP